MRSRDLLLHAYDQIQETLRRALDGLTAEQLTARVGPEANTIAWLAWHLVRVQDDHVAHLADVPQAYVAQGFAERFGFPFDPAAVGYGQSSEEVGQVQARREDLLAYHDAVDALTTAYLDRVDAAELARVVDDRWDPPVTAGVRLVSVLGDALQHLGQAGYLRGLAERAGA